IVFPLAAALLAVDVFVAPPTSPSNLDWQIKLHVTFALIAYSVLSIAALLAIFLALQERALRKHKIDSGLLRALPALTLTEALLFRLIAFGFVLLTLTLLSGALFVENLFAQHLVHKTVLSIAAWLVFGTLLFGRWRWGWRGRRAVQLTLIGMAVLLLAFFGSKFVLELVLRRVT
ncbi:MAG: cytochrome c biogenesis protein CcsA, partial [Dokdonella sp.]